LQDIPIVIMGSEKHMLLDLFNKPTAPLASFGTDIHLIPIDFEKYTTYIQERFDIYNIQISSECCKLIQTKMKRVPESINIVADNLLMFCRENNISKVDKEKQVNQVIISILSNKKSKYDNLLFSLSSNEENILLTIAKMDGVEQPNSKSFINKVSVSQRSISIIIRKLLQQGYLEYESSKYYISDPLLNLYLSIYR